MNARPVNSFVLTVLLAGLGLMLAGRAPAQTFTNLHNFTGGQLGPSGYYTNSDGAGPEAGLVVSGNTVYGTAYGGGINGYGTVFKVNTGGSGFTNVHNFIYGTFADGAWPQAGLVLSGNTLYGTTSEGGSVGLGTVFKINTDGTGFGILHSFLGDPQDGDGPAAGLILSGSTLYGTTKYGGTLTYGTVFAINTNSSSYTNLYNFTGGSDGANPQASLVLSGNALYGTTMAGGTNGNGAVFKVNTNGTGFVKLYSFTALDGINANLNDDGAAPLAGLILSGNVLYGTASAGGTNGNGSLFAVNTDGTGFANFYSFTRQNAQGNNNDGTFPAAALILSGNTLYGTAANGGTSGTGTIFAVHTNGTSLRSLYNFTAFGQSTPTNSDGANPYGSLILSGNTLYGTSADGGTGYSSGSSTPGNGTVYSISFGTPQLTILRSGTNVMVTLPTNASGFTLQSATNLASTAVWSAVSPAPVIVNGQDAVTNSISGARKFYRLSQ